jgi:hypothetical protein
LKNLMSGIKGTVRACHWPKLGAAPAAVCFLEAWRVNVKNVCRQHAKYKNQAACVLQYAKPHTVTLPKKDANMNTP